MTEDRFLTSAELQDLTGLVQPRAQIRWLRKERVRVFVRADGHPRVLWSALQGRVDIVHGPATQPNFEALRAAR